MLYNVLSYNYLLVTTNRGVFGNDITPAVEAAGGGHLQRKRGLAAVQEHLHQDFRTLFALEMGMSKLRQ